MDRSVHFGSEEQIQRVLGINDRNLPYLEALLGGDLFVKGNTLTIRSDDENTIGRFTLLFNRLDRLAATQSYFSEAEIFLEFQAVRNDRPISELMGEERAQGPCIVVHNRIAYPKSPRQEKYITSMATRQIVFGIGPAGTGKTFLAVAHALSQLLGGKRQKIILTRPIVEAGENLGFLPGDLAQKINPYLRPLYDAMEAMISVQNIRRLEDNGSIEIAPLAYMRGRSLQNATVILDEAQNTTREQMQMFLTRLGENSSAIITGDISQVDLPRSKDSGLIHAAKILCDIEGLDFVYFDSRDVVRSRIVSQIIDAYAEDGQRRGV
ncbi:MAG: PhoH family protein [Sphaerochaeta sp.]|jgi:phosphate starvation-inducible PhoH-like protein|nr:PhoH family protein [Sphaerochaeta sp.]MDX9914324.1 PhoH family protein [Sphaerochaeta sp.]